MFSSAKRTLTISNIIFFIWMSFAYIKHIHCGPEDKTVERQPGETYPDQGQKGKNGKKPEINIKFGIIWTQRRERCYCYHAYMACSHKGNRATNRTSQSGRRW